MQALALDNSMVMIMKLYQSTYISAGGPVMIGAMPAVTVRHERRKNTKDHPDAEPGLLHGPSKNVRPKGSNLLKSQLASPSSAASATSGISSGAGTPAKAATTSLAPSSACGAHQGDPRLLSAPLPSATAAGCGLVKGCSLASSRAGSPVAADPAVVLMYGDECCYAKVSLLHFIVFFFLGGITVMIIGAVQVSTYSITCVCKAAPWEFVPL